MIAVQIRAAEPNDFIPSNFEIRPQECFFEQPVLIDEDDHYGCYFKNEVFELLKLIGDSLGSLETNSTLFDAVML